MSDLQYIPPRFYAKLLKAICKKELFEELNGDLIEEFYLNTKHLGEAKARRIYRAEVLKLIRPSTIKSLKLTSNLTVSTMFKINTKLALRNLLKHKLYTAINIGGLAISTATCILILLFVQSETSYDNYHPDKERLFRLAVDRFYPDHLSQYAPTPVSVAEQAAIDFPEIEAFSKIYLRRSGVNMTYENETFLEKRLIAADPNFFSFFGIKLIDGTPNDVLTIQNGAVISENTATKYFGNDQAIGKILSSDLGELIVTGVAQNTPHNTHFNFDILVNFEMFNLGFLEKPNFLNFSVYNYLRLEEGVEPEIINKKFDQIVENYAAGEIERRLKMSFADYKSSGNGYNYYLQPIQDIHLNSRLEGEFEVNGNITYVYMFLITAIFIVVLAMVNFINLATARSAERAKEVGIRKVVGSLKRQLIGQFLTESIFVSLLGAGLGFGLAYFLLPAFNDFTNKNINLLEFISPLSVATFLFFSLLLGIVAGLYPAFFLSSFRPVVVLKGKLIHGKKGHWIRNSLVVFQFLISIILICSTLIVGQQMSFMQNRNLGFNQENVLILQRAQGVQDMETFKTEIARIPGVNSVGGASALPGSDEIFFGGSFEVEGLTESLALNCMVVEDNFFNTMGMDLMMGRAFQPNFEDSLSLIINESAALALGIADNPVGRTIINNQGRANPGGDKPYRVVGVVKDFNYQSLHNEITPLAIFSNEGYASPNLANLVVQVNNSQATGIITSIEELWNKQAPNQTFLYNFLDDNLNQLYAAEKKSGELFLASTGIAMLIACIGLFGLSTFIISSRIKEIGIRKVLGASSTGVVRLLINDFNKLILLATVTAIPVVIWIMSNWLDGFAYRIRIGDTWTSFIMGAISALGVAWITVSYHSIKAARSNPVKNLRSE